MSEADVSPTQITVEWEVENFFHLPMDDGYVMRTRPFPFAKGQYLLQLRPNGERENNSAGWTCLYLMKIRSPSDDRIGFTVGVKRADGSIFQSVDQKFIFAEADVGYGERLSSRAELIEHRNEVAPNGNLTLFCSARLNLDSVEAVASQTALSGRALKTLSENFKNLFISESQGDITVKTKDKDFTAHRSVLAARSSVFRAMLEVDMVENNEGVIAIEDCDASCLESFLLFLYAGDLTVVSANNAVGLYYLADKYNITELKSACSQCLSLELTTDTVCEVVRLAALYGETKLLESTTDFFTNNMADIVSSPKWVPFLLDNTSVANELLVKAANNLKK